MFRDLSFFCQLKFLINKLPHKLYYLICVKCEGNICKFTNIIGICSLIATRNSSLRNSLSCPCVQTRYMDDMEYSPLNRQRQSQKTIRQPKYFIYSVFSRNFQNEKSWAPISGKMFDFIIFTLYILGERWYLEKKNFALFCSNYFHMNYKKLRHSLRVKRDKSRIVKARRRSIIRRDRFIVTLKISSKISHSRENSAFRQAT